MEAGSEKREDQDLGVGVAGVGSSVALTFVLHFPGTRSLSLLSD